MSSLLVGALLISVTLAVYRNSLNTPFIFDDTSAIEKNLAIRHLVPLRTVLMPQHEGGLTTGGRPFLNLSFAANYAINGLHVRGYHLINLAIHIGNGLLLFEIVRRTLLRDVVAKRFGEDATLLGSAIAILWLVHRKR